MSGILVLLAVMAGVSVPEVHAVRFTTIDYRAAMRVLVSEDMPPAEIVRKDHEVLIRLPAWPRRASPSPTIEGPLAGLRVDREEDATVLRVNVAPEVPYETRVEPGIQTVIFGERPSPEPGPAEAKATATAAMAPVACRRSAPWPSPRSTTNRRSGCWSPQTCLPPSSHARAMSCGSGSRASPRRTSAFLRSSAPWRGSGLTARRASRF